MRVIRSETHTKGGYMNVNAELVKRTGLVHPADFSHSGNGHQVRLKSKLPGTALGLALPGLSSASPRRSALHRVGSVQQSNPLAIPYSPSRMALQKPVMWQMSALFSLGAQRVWQ